MCGPLPGACQGHGPGGTARKPSPRLLAAAVLGLGCAASLALNWPGQLSYDSVVQLHDARLGHYNPWHPPVMAWMLGIADSLVPGTGLFVLVDGFLLFGSLVSLLWIPRRMSRCAVVAAALCVALPQLLLYQGIVWKDVLFADSAVAGFVLLAQVGARRRHHLLRWSLVCASFLLLVLATLARQNGVVVLIFGALGLVMITRKQGAGWMSAVAAGSAAFACGLCVAIAASAALMERTGGVSGTPGQIRLLELYDLIGEAKLDPALKLETLSRANPDLVQLMRTDGARLYTPVRNDTLVASAALQNEFADTAPTAISLQWQQGLTRHPWDYLRVRAQVFDWVFLTPDLRRCVPYYTGINGPPQYLKELGLKRQFRPQDALLANYAALFVATPVFSHAAYAVLALVLLVFLFARRDAPDLAIAAMLAGALAFAASFFVISIACDYRYLLFLDLAALTSLFYCAATWRTLRRA